MNKLNFTFLLMFFSLSIFGQKGMILGIGVNQTEINTDDPIPLRNDNYRSIFITYDWVPMKDFGLGLDLYKSISGDINVIDGRLKLGTVINKKSRLQFPLNIHFGFYSLQEDNQPKYGSILYGGQAGIRFYLTNNLSIQGMYNYSFYPVGVIDGEALDESLGTINSKGISIGLLHYFSNK